MISIIVPVLNEAMELPELIPALHALLAEGAEVIVVDGGSDDDTPSRLRLEGFTVLPAPAGRARQMNHGASRARGDHLLFLHADTRLPAGTLGAVTDALATGAPGWGRFDVRIVGRSRWLPLVATMINLRSRLTGIATGDQALFLRRDHFVDVGGFPDQPLMEDVELSHRLRARFGRPVCLGARVRTSGRRWDTRGAWRTIVLMWRLRWAYWRGDSPVDLAERYR